MVWLHHDQCHLAKLQVLNHLAANAPEAAGDVVASELVDFLLHASPPQH
jgi:hypothetical protein